MIDKRHMKWAAEALVNYAVYRVQGATPNVCQKEDEEPAEWFKDLSPDLGDLWVNYDSWSDMEHGDYLLVRTQLAVHSQANPQDTLLGDFLTHLFYHRQTPESFRVHLPFQRGFVGLGTISKMAVANAMFAVAQVLKLVAQAKAEAENEEKIAEAS